MRSWRRPSARPNRRLRPLRRLWLVLQISHQQKTLSTLSKMEQELHRTPPSGRSTRVFAKGCLHEARKPVCHRAISNPNFRICFLRKMVRVSSAIAWPIIMADTKLACRFPFRPHFPYKVPRNLPDLSLTLPRCPTHKHQALYEPRLLQLQPNSMYSSLTQRLTRSSQLDCPALLPVQDQVPTLGLCLELQVQAISLVLKNLFRLERGLPSWRISIL